MRKLNLMFLFLLATLPLVAGNGGGQRVSDVKGAPSLIIFDGMQGGPNLQMWAWGNSSIEFTEGTGITASKNALKWTQGDQWGNGWTGFGFTVDPAYDLSSVWNTDSIHFSLKCEAGLDTMRIQYEGGGGKVGKKFKPIDDNVWHNYVIALKDLIPQDGTTGFTPNAVGVVGIMAEGDAKDGKVVYVSNWWTGNPTIAYPSIIFNGIRTPNNVTFSGWGNSAIETVVGAGTSAKTNALKWTQGDQWSNGWSGISAAIPAGLDLAGAWLVDSVQFKLKCESGVGALRLQYEDGTAKMGVTFTPNTDGAWHTYKFAFSSFVPEDGTTGFKPGNVTVVGLMAEASAKAGKVIYITDWWSGNPVFDVVPPDAPSGILVVPGTYANIVTWNDVPGEAGERYNVYYSTSPITDISTAEVVKLGIAEGNQIATHLLRAPNTNQSVTYYYAITCTDKAGNVSPVSISNTPVTNTAKGVNTISLTVPKNFVADGDLSEWASIPYTTIQASDGSGFIVTNQVISSDADLSVKSWLAIDKDYLYAAFDVTDDIVSFNPALSTYLNDCPDIFLGFYNQHGLQHTTYKHGSTPDYHFRFAKDRLLLDGGADSILVPGANYYWGEKFTPGYIIEAKISLKNLAAKSKDSVFVPVEGMRIPLDYSINDADATGSREGILTYSPYNEDQSWNDPSRWLYTWIGNKWNPSAVKDAKGNTLTYMLAQNYPNPFNPTTKITFSLEKAGNVSLKVFDVLGREVATLINGMKEAGKHTVSFDASKLASGLYIYRIESGSFVDVKKMMLVR
jgi:hypothetical protein